MYVYRIYYIYTMCVRVVWNCKTVLILIHAVVQTERDTVVCGVYSVHCFLFSV